MAEHTPDDAQSQQHNDTGAAVPPAVEGWLRGLLDLSRLNPLIALPPSAVPLAVTLDTLPAVAAAVSGGVPVVVRGSDDLDELDLPEETRHASHLDTSAVLALLEEENIVWAAEDTAEIRRSLPDLRRRSEVIREQTGANPLYLTLGALAVTENGVEDVAPLFLLPVTVDGRRYDSWTVQLDTQGAVRVNESLAERLRRSYGFEHEALRNPPHGAEGVDVSAALTQLGEAVRAAGLDEKASAEVRPDAALALLEYSTVEMWRDLSEHWATYARVPLVQRLIDRDEATTEATDGTVAEHAEQGAGVTSTTLADETDRALPLPFDGSQLHAVAWADQGRSFVLDGPPGTGKSQTIANVIADSVSRGRRVLFVAEKDAAIDVVARRLDSAGLKLRCLDLRGKDQTVRQVRTHLTAALSRENSGQGQRVEALREELRELVGALADHPRNVRDQRDDQHDDGAPHVDAGARRSATDEFCRVSDELRVALAATLGDVEPTVEAASEAMDALREELRGGRIEGMAELIRAHLDAILQGTPCLFMSPASVSRFLPGRAELFDLVLFDEASQMTVADAVPALGRARAAVICGDPKQMPPANLFRSHTQPGGEADQGDDGAGGADEEESILLEAVRLGVPRLRLTWHYRSRAESLVAFSNERYYDGELTTFPEPPGGVRGDGVPAGVEFRFVEGGYFGAARRKPPLNIVEANAVVDEVRRLVDADPHVSLGVIAFSASQRNDILDKLESDASSPQVRAALRRDVEPVFVKTLEHVQGDERDHVLFSLTYSLHDADRLARDYGLLRSEGGEQRFNVAVTRARVRNVLFCSWQPETFDHVGALPPGIAHLRDYVRAARDGAFDPVVESTPAGQHAAGTDAALSKVVTELAGRLREAGCEVQENVGRSDFRVDVAVRRPGRTWVAVLLDTRAWAERPVTTDRDEVPYLVLPQMGWADVAQVYASEWRADADSVVERLTGYADAAPEETAPALPTADEALDRAPVGPAAQPEDPVVAAARAQAEAVRRATGEGRHDTGPVLVEFVAADEDPRGERAIIARLPDETAASMVATAWREIVDVEGPVHVGRAARLIARRYGWRRLPWAEFCLIAAALPPELQRVSGGFGTDENDEFVWGEGVSRDTYRVVRGETRATRKPLEIAPEEREGAIRLVLTEAGGRASEAGILRGVREVFGFGFLSGQLRPAFLPVIDHLTESGELRREGRDLVLAPQEKEPVPLGTNS